ncbi:guanylate kinase [Arcanobacterium pluranimalium]|uniref:guanylate kinase n=1 Tax=Arcanobacterium pluranimalium TaxID=108028 RepID=UPI0019579CBD|nr:guanylate kinase [Arcanobacterium pluranimalium]MBM7825435.1 guanylate kinase [Arcanobacterium pluranimalium]
MTKNQGSAYVVCGPTAVGKGTVLKEVFRKGANLWYSVSATTRPARPGEIDGKDYFFVSNQEFDELVNSGEMLEWAVVHKIHRYGTPRKPVEKAIAEGKIVILEVDLDGARQIRKTMPEVKQIFIAPPSWEELKARLIGRATECEEEQSRRLETAKIELEAQGEFDVVVVNESVADATEKILHILGISE